MGQRAFAAADELLVEALALDRAQAQESGSLVQVVLLLNLGEVAYGLGQPARGDALFAEALTNAQQEGTRQNIALVLIEQGFYTSDPQPVQAGLRLAWEIGALSTVLFGLIGGARLLLRAGQVERAAVVLGAVAAHPAHSGYNRIHMSIVLEELRAQGPVAAVEAALRRGQGQELAPLVALILSVPASGPKSGPQ